MGEHTADDDNATENSENGDNIQYTVYTQAIKEIGHTMAEQNLSMQMQITFHSASLY